MSPEKDLTDAMVDAARNAIQNLFRDYPHDTFYYCSLVTTGEGHTPSLTAWSKEKLREVVRADRGGSELAADLKWSYADSPFYGYGEHLFDTVKRMLIARSAGGDRDSTTDRGEYELRLRAMEAAMAQLDSEGMFGVGPERLGIVINAEVMPPDHTNVARALRLNPREALADWLVEAAEPAQGLGTR